MLILIVICDPDLYVLWVPHPFPSSWEWVEKVLCGLLEAGAHAGLLSPDEDCPTCTTHPRYKLFVTSGDAPMPRGTIPRQPSKAGRQDKAKTSRVATKPPKITPARKPPAAAKKTAANPPRTKAYNPSPPNASPPSCSVSTSAIPT